MNMPTVAGTQWLSWNTARLLALILNALGGLVNYFDKNLNELTVNELFGLRQSQQLLHQINIEFANNGLNKEIFESIRNFSSITERLIERGIDRLSARNAELAKEVRILFA